MLPPAVPCISGKHTAFAWPPVYHAAAGHVRPVGLCWLASSILSRSAGDTNRTAHLCVMQLQVMHLKGV